MNTRTRSIALASAIYFALSLSAPLALAADASVGITNARMESQIWTTYMLSPYLRSHDLRVSVVDGIATLEGVVEEDVNKDLAEQIARGVDGISKVDNRIAVKADYRPSAKGASRKYGDKVDDATTTAVVRAKLSWSRQADAKPVEVTTRDGKVTLKGEADSAAAKSHMTQLARNTDGVTGVDDRLLTVQSTKSPAAEPTMGEAMADTWITTKVKSTFMYSSNVDGADISVSTLAGVVTLTGRVDSGAERALAIELARNIRGVKRVDASTLAFVPLDAVSAVGER
ncbi:BON domain-containing protein [Pseudomarimonas salicorniae]|uniref:BON domain-containing protein n=1 Tax=Pseudomarimonas salicorniae TaxID=2933270 RepID=A0ABT0GLD3_9GAMM|nr:BON domain-containing protein [Lysobacter sp. CAU 1642]MCK7595321.1 BON domain-containing protein [Lysobacter sp. CAU 1642]